MRSLLALSLFALTATASSAQPAHIAPTDAKTPAEELKTFKLPPGFEAQLVAAEPDIGKPIQCSFDAKGRLWVATSRHYPHPATGPASDRIFVLSDIDPATGKAGKVTTFATDLNIPIGVMPLPDCNSCIASEVGRVVKLTDTDGDGKADKRETVLDGFGVKDTHGMTNSFLLMPDGWIYACHGFSNTSTIRGKDGHSITMQSGSTYRFRPDGSRVEIHTRGQVNPFGLTCDPWFNLYTADCHSKPITQLIPGATYQSFGKPHDGIGYAPHAARHDHGSTALCGLAWLSSPQFPAGYDGRMVLGNVVTNRVNCDKMTWDGASPSPTSGPICSPAATRGSAPSIANSAPMARSTSPTSTTKLSATTKSTSTTRGAINSRAACGESFTPARGQNRTPRPKTSPSCRARKSINCSATRTSSSACKRRSNSNAATTCRRSTPMGNEFYRAHRVWVGDGVPPRPGESELVRTHRIKRSLGQAQANRLGAHELLALTEALAARPEAANVGRILTELPAPKPGDTHQDYASRIALRNALAAPGGFEAAAKFPQLAGRIVAAALGVPTPASAEYLARSQAAQMPEAYRLVGQHGADAALAAVTAKLATRPDAAAIVCMEALAQGRQSRGRPLPGDSLALAERLCEEGLARAEPGVAATSANLAATLHFKALAPAITRLVSRADRPAALRADAARALAALAPDAALLPLTNLLNDANADTVAREGAAFALARVNSSSAREKLLAALAVAPARLATPIALALAESEGGARQLLDAVAGGKASPRLLTARPVRDLLNKRGVGAEVNRLTKSLPSEDARLTRLIAERSRHYADSPANVIKGKALFTKNCAACHRIGDEGGKVGPQLDGVGNRGLDRVMEDILTPSRNVDAAFRATTLTLLDGRVVTGLVVREEGRSRGDRRRGRPGTARQ